jgi:ribose transport system substrate-binding protein
VLTRHRIRVATLGLGCVAAIAIVGTGCGSSDDKGAGGSSSSASSTVSAEPKKVTIGWTPPDVTGVFKTATDYLERGAKDANANGFDVKVLTRSPATHTDFASQQAIIEDYISKKVDVIVVSPSDVQAVKPAVKEANQAGIPVIMVNLLEKQDDIDVASYIGFDNSDAASVSAYAVLDYFGGPGVLGTGPKVDVKPDTFLDLKWWQQVYGDAEKQAPKGGGAIIEGIAGTFFSQERLDGFNKVISQFPGVKVLGKPLAADWNREKGVKAAENFASRYPPAQLNFLWAASNEMALGAMQALERKGTLNSNGPDGEPQGKTAIFTNDNTPESTDAIRAGKIIAETTHGFPEWGWFGSEFAVKLACDEEVPEKLDIRPRTVWKGNTDQFYPQPKLQPIDWKKIRAAC